MSRQDKPFRADCNHYLQLLPMIDFYATFYCTHCGGVRNFPALDLSTKTPEALGVELLAELGGTVGPAVPLELPRWADDDEFEPGRAVALADIPFIEWLDAWVDKCVADGTLTLAKAAEYREAIAARCVELGEVPHVRQHLVALQLKAGDILGIVSPSESSSLMSSMGRYASELLKAVGADGVGVLVFPPGTEFHVLEGAATQVSDKVREYVDSKVQVVEDKTAQASNSLLEQLQQVRAGVMTTDRIRAMLAEEIRLSVAMGRTHQ